MKVSVDDKVQSIYRLRELTENKPIPNIKNIKRPTSDFQKSVTEKFKSYFGSSVSYFSDLVQKIKCMCNGFYFAGEHHL